MAEYFESLGLNIPTLTTKPEETPEKPPPRKSKLLRQKKKELRILRMVNAKKTQMRNELGEELELSRRTAKKIKLNWQNTLRDSKLVELKSELLEWEEKTTRQFHNKDKFIQEKLIEWDQLEELNRLNMANSKKFADYLSYVFKTLSDGSKLFYDTCARDAVREFEEELKEKRNKLRNSQIYCENIMHTTNVICEHEMMEDYKYFVEERNDIANTEIDKCYTLRDNIVKKLQDGRQQLISFVEMLATNVLDPNKYDNIRKLIGRQRFFSSEFERLREQEAKQQVLLNDLNRELLKSEIICQRRIQELRLEQSFFSEVRNKHRHKLQWDRQMTLEKMKLLGGKSYAVLQYFKKYADFGEKLLSTAATVRKFQTQGEKICIWGDLKSVQNNSDIFELKKFMMTEINSAKQLDRKKEEFYNEIKTMRIFWRRLAIVETQNAMLTKEKLQLLAENKKYIDFIRSMSTKPMPEKLKDTLFVQNIKQLQEKCSVHCHTMNTKSVS